MRPSDRPAAPKKPSMPARAIASTISTEAMPLAIAPGEVGELQAVVAAERRVAQGRGLDAGHEDRPGGVEAQRAVRQPQRPAECRSASRSGTAFMGQTRREQRRRFGL